MINENDERDLCDLMTEVLRVLSIIALAFFITLVSLIVGCDLARADLPVNVMLVDGEGALPYPAIRVALDETNSYLKREVGIALDQVGESQFYDPSVCPLTYDSFYSDGFVCWEKFARENGFLKRKKVLSLAILPPISDGSQKYLAGASYVGKLGTAPSFTVVYCGGSAAACSVILSHEILHALGAQHISSSPNIMHPTANDLQLLPRTKKQIERQLDSVDLLEYFKR